VPGATLDASWVEDYDQWQPRSIGALPLTRATCRTRGDISEFEKLEGCVTCLSVLLPGR
jgi:hypothetical protein